jgi:hypothetical protein
MGSDAEIKKSASRITGLSVQIPGLASQKIYTSSHTHEIARNPENFKYSTSCIGSTEIFVPSFPPIFSQL